MIGVFSRFMESNLIHRNCVGPVDFCIHINTFSHQIFDNLQMTILTGVHEASHSAMVVTLMSIPFSIDSFTFLKSPFSQAVKNSTVFKFICLWQRANDNC